MAARPVSLSVCSKLCLLPDTHAQALKSCSSEPQLCSGIRCCWPVRLPMLLLCLRLPPKARSPKLQVCGVGGCRRRGCAVVVVGAQQLKVDHVWLLAVVCLLLLTVIPVMSESEVTTRGPAQRMSLSAACAGADWKKVRLCWRHFSSLRIYAARSLLSRSNSVLLNAVKSRSSRLLPRCGTWGTYS